jgi:3-oxoacyl-[acyl-carrier protein] reductase
MSRDSFSPTSLEGKTALVTGGSRGIGRAISVTLARAGAFVAVNYRVSEQDARATLTTIREHGGDGMLVPFDVTDSAAVERGVALVLAERGRVDILVNNAGINRDGLLSRMKDADWHDVLDTNLAGAFRMCRTLSKSMIRNRSGKIINVASTAGEAGNAGQANYSAAKAGLIGFTRALARELAPRNILVNAVSPGIVTGGMTDRLTEKQAEAISAHIPVGKMGKSEDVAAVVLFLSSSMSDYVTGQVIRVNGGLYM